MKTFRFSCFRMIEGASFLFTTFCLPLFSLCPLLFSHSAAKRKMWKLKSFGSLRNINKTGNE